MEQTEFIRKDWIIGKSLLDSTWKCPDFLTHRTYPRFIAKVIKCDSEEHMIQVAKEKQQEGFTFGAAYNMLLCEFDWIDEPHTSEMPTLLNHASLALEEGLMLKPLFIGAAQELGLLPKKNLDI